MLTVERLPVLNDNYMYLIHENERGVTAVVDPAVAQPVLERLETNGWSLDWIIATHHHPDHVAGIADLKEATGAKVMGPKAERESIPQLDVELVEGDTFKIGDAEARVIETPGHTLGHISCWFKQDKALFCADALFALGCGRVFEGTMEQMWQSLEKLRELPDDTLVYCGHEYTLSNAQFALTVDPENEALKDRAEEVERMRAEGDPTVPSLLGLEKKTNPFLRPDDEEIRRHLGMPDATDGEVFAAIRRRKDEA